MGNHASPGTYRELAKAFIELFDEAGPRDLEEVHALLEEAGFDPEEVGTRFRTIAEQELSTSHLNWRVRAARELETERSHIEAARTTKELSREKIVSRIQELLSKFSSAPRLLTAHRNLDQASDEDLRALLAEIEYLASHTRPRSDSDKE